LPLSKDGLSWEVFECEQPILTPCTLIPANQRTFWKKFILMAEIQIAGPFLVGSQFEWGERFSQACWAASTRSMIQQQSGLIGNAITDEDLESFVHNFLLQQEHGP
jgi:hypothetical protein